jgi:hypothetical protein
MTTAATLTRLAGYLTYRGLPQPIHIELRSEALAAACGTSLILVQLRTPADLHTCADLLGTHTTSRPTPHGTVWVTSVSEVDLSIEFYALEPATLAVAS